MLDLRGNRDLRVAQVHLENPDLEDYKDLPGRRARAVNREARVKRDTLDYPAGLATWDLRVHKAALAQPALQASPALKARPATQAAPDLPDQQASPDPKDPRALRESAVARARPDPRVSSDLLDPREKEDCLDYRVLLDRLDRKG